MASGFWKSNEKVVMTLLLLILAPTFAASGVMYWWFTDGRQMKTKVYALYGGEISIQDLNLTKERVEKQLTVRAMRLYGPFGSYRGVSDQRALDTLKLEHLADELGLQVGETQAQQALRAAALDVLTWYQILRDRGWTPKTPQPLDYEEMREVYNSTRNDTVFNADEYVYAVTSGVLGAEMSVQSFEAAVIAATRTSIVPQLVQGIAVAPQAEVYNEFAAQRGTRTIEYVQVKSTRYEEQAALLVDEDYLRQVFDENPQRYKSDAAARLTVAKAVRENFIDPGYEPSLDEITAAYERDKATKYRQYRAPDWEKPEDYDPEVDDFKPLVDVLPAVEKTLKDARALAAEEELFATALAKAAELREAGTPFTLEELFDEGTAGTLVFEELDWFTRLESYQIDQRFRNPAEMGLLFNDADPARVGEISSTPVPNVTGSFIYRIEGLEPPGQKTFEEAVADVTTEAERRKASDLTAEYLAEAVGKIRAGEITFEEWASNENYTVHAPEESLARFDGSKLRIDDRPVPYANTMLNGVFDQTTAVGDITDPIVPAAGKELYLARLTGITGPPMDNWALESFSISMRVQQAHGASVNDQFDVRVNEAANLIPLFAVEEPAPPEEGIDEES